MYHTHADDRNAYLAQPSIIDPETTSRQGENRMPRFTTLLLSATIAIFAALAGAAPAGAESPSDAPNKTPMTMPADLPDDESTRSMPAAGRLLFEAFQSPDAVRTRCAFGAISYYGEVDRWTFTINAAERYVLVEMDRMSGNLDPVLAIYDPFGRLVAFNDDESLYSLDSAVVFRPTMTGTYTARLMSFNHAGVGTYMLWVHTSDRPFMPH